MPSGGRPLPSAAVLIAPGPPNRVLAAVECGVSDEEARSRARTLDRRLTVLGLPLRSGTVLLPPEPRSEALVRLAETLEKEQGRLKVFPGLSIPFDRFEELARLSPHAIGGVSGDPSPFTARGVFHAIRACLGPPDGKRIAVQGAGRVGSRLVALLIEAGAEVLVADLDRDRAAATGATVVEPGTILFTGCDLLSPCARHVRLTRSEAAQLRCGALAGADDILESVAAPAGLRAVPELVAGSGWLLSLVAELEPEGWTEEAARASVARIERVVRTRW